MSNSSPSPHPEPRGPLFHSRELIDSDTLSDHEVEREYRKGYYYSGAHHSGDWDVHEFIIPDPADVSLDTPLLDLEAVRLSMLKSGDWIGGTALGKVLVYLYEQRGILPRETDLDEVNMEYYSPGPFDTPTLSNMAEAGFDRSGL